MTGVTLQHLFGESSFFRFLGIAIAMTVLTINKNGKLSFGLTGGWLVVWITVCLHDRTITVMRIPIDFFAIRRLHVLLT